MQSGLENNLSAIDYLFCESCHNYIFYDTLNKGYGLDIKKFFNTSGNKYRELGLKDKLDNMSFDEKVKLLSSDGMLIKRPLVIGKKIIPGFKNYDSLK